MSLVDDLAQRINFRDLGGMSLEGGGRIAPGRLYRSALLGRLEEEIRRAMEDELGLTDVVDLRRHLESKDNPQAQFSRASVHRMPLVPDGEKPVIDPYDSYDSVADWYLRQVTLGAESVRRIFELLAQEREGALLIHCHAGKDRTGSVLAVILSAVGVPREEILEDYAKSGTMVGDHFLDALPPKFAEANPQSLRRFLEKLEDEYGSVEGFVKEIGVEDDVVSRIRAQLAEPAGGHDRV